MKKLKLTIILVLFLGLGAGYSQQSSAGDENIVGKSVLQHQEADYSPNISPETESSNISRTSPANSVESRNIQVENQVMDTDQSNTDPNIAIGTVLPAQPDTRKSESHDQVSEILDTDTPNICRPDLK